MNIPKASNNLYSVYIGWSFLKFEPIIPAFQPPSGTLLHEEAFKLLPNYAYPNSDYAPEYTIERGGVYPSMSKNNVFNVYLNIIWSAGVGDAVNC